jgi:hypothetical protein
MMGIVNIMCTIAECRVNSICLWWKERRRKVYDFEGAGDGDEGGGAAAAGGGAAAGEGGVAAGGGGVAAGGGGAEQ